MVLKGEMEIAFRDGAVIVGAGEVYVVPKGREHIARAHPECQALLIEPRGVANTVNAGGTNRPERRMGLAMPKPNRCVPPRRCPPSPRQPGARAPGVKAQRQSSP